MDIGQPKRIIEIVPATLPVPGEFEPGELEPVGPDSQPEAAPDLVPSEPEPVERPV